MHDVAGRRISPARGETRATEDQKVQRWLGGVTKKPEVLAAQRIGGREPVAGELELAAEMAKAEQRFGRWRI